MAGNSRLEDLRRRVQKDPASIAFAQLAEEYRRAGEHHQAVEVCRAGLAIHPGYLSARVTLARALIELNQLEDAQAEIEHVLASAPENLAAIRGLAEIHHRRGERAEALEQYRAALALAPNDPDLEETVNDLARELAAAPRRSDPVDGLSLEQAAEAFARHLPPPAAETAPAPTAPEPHALRVPEPQAAPVAPDVLPAPVVPDSPAVVQFAADVPDLDIHAADGGGDDHRDKRTVAALETWLSAIHVARTDRKS
jgi:tetratricopeptide (TPR) repeat protein